MIQNKKTVRNNMGDICRRLMGRHSKATSHGYSSYRSAKLGFKRKLTFSFVTVVLLASAFIALRPYILHAAGNTYYVAQGGGCDNAHPGSEAEPWCTIQYAADYVSAGDTIYIKAGTYYEEVSLYTSGTLTDPIIYSNYQSDQVIIDGSMPLSASWTVYSGNIYQTTLAASSFVYIEDGTPLEPKEALTNVTSAGSYFMDNGTKTLYVWSSDSASPSSHTLRVSDPDRPNGIVAQTWPMGGTSYNTVKGLSVRYTNDDGIANQANNRTGFNIENVNVSWTGGTSVTLRNGTESTVTNSVFSDALDYGARSVNLYEETDGLFEGNEVKNSRCDLLNVTSSLRVTVKDNVIHDNFYGSGCHPDLVQLQAASGIWNDGVIVEGNTMYNSDTLGIMASYTHNTIVRNNIMYGTDGAGMDFGYAHTNLKIYNNTLEGLSLRIHGDVAGAVDGVSVRNNILGQGNYDSDAANFSSDYNIYTLPDPGYYLHWSSGAQFGPRTLAQFRSQTGNEMHGIRLADSAAVSYVDLANHDYRLRSDSPAMDVGIDHGVDANVPLNDIDGNIRNGVTDIGAYEYLGENYYINADCANNGDGSSWSCASSPGGAGAYSNIPADSTCAFNGYIWIRGATYWIAGSDNTYGTGCFRLESGTGRIILKKASTSDHGTNTGWQAAYGSKQAVTGKLVVWASAVTIDGSYRSGAESGYGIKIQGVSSDSLISSPNNINTSGNIFKYIELTHTSFDATTGSGINLNGGGSNTIQYIYAHDLSGLCFKGGKDPVYSTIDGLDNTIIEESVCGDTGKSTGASHTEMLKDDGEAVGTIIRNNMFYDWGGTSVTGGLILSGGQTDWKIYNNIFTEKDEDSSCGNGVISGLTDATGYTGIKVYNNTFANIEAACSNIFAAALGDFSGAGNEVSSNLFYNTSALTSICSGGCTKSKNWFYVTPGYTLTGNDISGSADPFTNSGSEDFTLAFGAGPIDLGLDLSSVLIADKNGTARPQGDAFDIGAYEYIPITYSLTYNGNTNTSGSAPIDSNTYEQTDTVTVLGNTGTLVKTGYTFAGWNTASNGSGTNYAPADTFSMPASNVTLYARWTIDTHTLVTTANPLAGGSADGDGTYDYNTSVDITASNSPGYTFDHWSGDCGGTDASTSVVMSADKTCIANFTLDSAPDHSVATGVSPASSGTVTGAGNYSDGGSATITASANEGYEFDHWSGDCSGSTSPYSLTNITVDKSCTANFNTIHVFDITPTDLTHSESGTTFSFGDIPAGVTGIDILVTPTTTSPHSVPVGHALERLFSITATDQDGDPITTGLNVNLTFTYAGAKSSDTVMYWDGTKWSGEGISNIVHDLGNNTISFSTTHFSEYAIFDAGIGAPNTGITVNSGGGWTVLYGVMATVLVIVGVMYFPIRRYLRAKAVE